MGKLKVIKVGPMATVQDRGRFGYRQYGIPQSGAMDVGMMKEVNYLVGNPEDNPVIEFAILGLKLEAIEPTIVGIAGASGIVNDNEMVNTNCLLKAGDMLTLSKPNGVYGYLGIGGLLKAKRDFESFSTYTMAGFGGIEGRGLKVGDILETQDESVFEPRNLVRQDRAYEPTTIRIMKGPEWSMLKESPEGKSFMVDPSSNRMGIRLTGANLKCDGSEIVSSAVIPGTIQLPASGEPIILMNDCQTTGGYPRIGKVIEEDMGKLAQVTHKKQIEFVMV